MSLALHSKHLRSSRPALCQYEFDAKHRRSASPSNCRSMASRFLKKFRRKKCSEYVRDFFPILDWLPAYRLSYLPNDVVAGITVAIYNVPQAMAYAVLAGLPPIIGLYSSFFPPLLYALFGTSREISVGMFSVTALMVGSVNARLSVINSNINNATASTGVGASYVDEVHAVQVATAMTFTIAVVLVVMSIFRLHFLVSYMSDELVSGYTTGAACHIVATQLPKIFGLSSPSHSGLLKLYYVLKDIVLSITQTNIPDLLTSLICIIFLHVGKWYINPRIKNRSRVPLPFELFAIIIATALSTVLDVQKRYRMEIVSSIPTGFPIPAMPCFGLMLNVFFDSIVTAVVIFAITISICKVFRKDRSNSVDASQELFALATVEFVISFFSCHPACGSLTRTVINSHCGAQTQVSSLISAGLLACAILWVAQLLTALPKCVLSAIIVVALETMFLQMKQVKALWKVSKIDMAIWLVSFLATVLWDVSQGLGVAVAFALITVVFRSQWPEAVQLVRVGETGLYKEVKHYRPELVDVTPENVRIYRFDSALLFLNVEYFKAKVYDVISIGTNSTETIGVDNSKTITGEEMEKDVESALDGGKGENSNLRYLILDASGFSEIDNQGVSCIKEIAKDLRNRNIEILVADVRVHVLERCKLCRIEESVPACNFFPSIQDAVLYVAKKNPVSFLQDAGDSDGNCSWNEKL